MNDPLHRHLDAALAAVPAVPLAVAFSGGPDSSALLHALAHLPEARQRGLRALHVDHGLHAASAAWAEHCRHFCDSLDVPCEVLRVQVDQAGGSGLEAAARDARHAALADQLRANEYLLFAHHRDDQAETVRRRLVVYGELTEPLIEWYRRSGATVVSVDAGVPVDEVHKAFRKAVEA